MKILLINPAVQSEQIPLHIPIRVGALARIADSLGHQVGIGDLNAHRESSTPESYRADLKTADWDLFYIHCDLNQYRGFKSVFPVVKSTYPQKPLAVGGALVEAVPEAVMANNPGINVAILSQLEDAFTDLLGVVEGSRWHEVPGVLYSEPHNERGFARSGRRGSIPPKPIFPAYEMLPLDEIYFKFSAMPFCAEATVSKKRLSFSWSRDGKLPAASKAVENVRYARFRFGVDFANIVDEEFMVEGRWTEKFCEYYINDELNQTTPWGCIGNVNTINKDPSIVRSLADAGCRYVELTLRSYSAAEQEAIDALKKTGAINVRLKGEFGRSGESFESHLESLQFALVNKVDVEPLVAKPNLRDNGGSFSGLEEMMLELYDRVPFVNVSDVFNFSDLLTVQALMVTKDLKSLLRFGHLRGFKHSEKWLKWCPACVA